MDRFDKILQAIGKLNKPGIWGFVTGLCLAGLVIAYIFNIHIGGT